MPCSRKTMTPSTSGLGWRKGTRAGRLLRRLRALFHKGRVPGKRGRISDAWDVLEEGIRLPERIANDCWRLRLTNQYTSLAALRGRTWRERNAWKEAAQRVRSSATPTAFLSSKAIREL